MIQTFGIILSNQRLGQPGRSPKAHARLGVLRDPRKAGAAMTATGSVGNREVRTKMVTMKTYQACVGEYYDNVPHKSDAYMLGFLDAVAFMFNKNRTQVAYDIQAYRTERIYEEEEA
jgi:hypothetical protein